MSWKRATDLLMNSLGLNFWGVNYVPQHPRAVTFLETHADVVLNIYIYLFSGPRGF